jgi:hypothetical protein
MKTMTCKQLGGACNEIFHAETFDDMVALSKNHGMEMAGKGDAAHIKVMEEMRKGMGNPKAVEKWVESKRQEFGDLPEDK